MPFEIFGRTTLQHGKPLWEILGNLRNHGVGRIVVRGEFERYSEPSWYKILEVSTLAPEGKIQVIPPLLDLGEVRRVRVKVDKFFRGQYMGEEWVSTVTYKPDFRLISLEEEEAYTKLSKGDKAPKFLKPSIAPTHTSMPPLMKELIMRDARSAGIKLTEEPKLRLVYNEGTRVAKDGEIPNIEVGPKLGKTKCPSLYANIKYP